MKTFTTEKVKRTQVTAYYADVFRQYIQSWMEREHPTGQYANSYYIYGFKVTLSARKAPTGGLFLTASIPARTYYQQATHTTRHRPGWTWEEFTRWSEHLLRRALHLQRQRILAKPLVEHLVYRLGKMVALDHDTKMELLERLYNQGYDPGFHLVHHSLYSMRLEQLEAIAMIVHAYIPESFGVQV